MPMNEKQGEKKAWETLVFPEKKESPKRYEKMVKRYEHTMKNYRDMAFHLHKELLRKKDGSSEKTS